MIRMPLAACAALVAAVGAARAADPQPLWEIDTTAGKLRPVWEAAAVLGN
jgi:hypothetical protein